MIELPAWAQPDSAAPAFIDFGGVLRPATGGPLLKVDRLGSRYRMGLTFPVFGDAAQGRVIVSRLIRAKREGLRVAFPLLEKQGAPGQPVVDGSGQAGSSIALRGLTPGYVLREGWWLSIVNAAGQHFLHNAGAETIVGSDGKVTLPLCEMLRVPFADGASVRLAQPMIEGLIDGDAQQWAVDVEAKVSIECMIEEAA